MTPYTVRCNFAHHSTEEGDEPKDQYEELCNEQGCLAVGYNDDWIGENLAASATSGSPSWDIDDVLSGITNWYDESKDYYWDTKTSYGTTGHWTQGVWAKTRYIGCGYAACDTGSPFGSSYSNWLMVVCKYFPGGNYGSGYPYTEGDKCSDCEDDRSSCSGTNSGLCDGGMCLDCAVDYFNSDCGYDSSSCPSTMYYNDGIGDTTTTLTPTVSTLSTLTANPTASPNTQTPTTSPANTPSPVVLLTTTEDEEVVVTDVTGVEETNTTATVDPDTNVDGSAKLGVQSVIITVSIVMALMVMME